MFKLSNSHLRNDLFMSAVQKVGNHPDFKNPRVSYNAAKIMRKIQNEGKFCQDEFIKLVKQYALLDEKGAIKPRMHLDKPVHGTFEIDPAKQEDWEKALEIFHAIEFEVPCHKLRLDDLVGVRLTPFDLAELDPMLDDSAAPVVAAAKPGSPLQAVPAQQPSAPN